MVNTVEVRHVSKRFTLRHTRSLKEMLVWMSRGRDLSDTFLALDDVALDVAQGEAIGLLGFNGSGKSTLLKLISGVMRPDAGSIGVRGRVAGLIEVGAGFHPDLTGRENIYLNGATLGMSRQQIDRLFDSIVDFSGISRFLDSEVKFYSSGMFFRLAFAVAVHTEPDVFLVDEILAVGDEPFQRMAVERIKQLRSEGRTLIMVSHDLDLVDRICDRGIVLREGRLEKDTDISTAIDFLRQSDRT
ncbi:ABC transporter ATP-binding protein [Oryzihumus leptocrescens]|uniref:ABC-2 type transport system ATP-binding protein n=1 Tax=Oryzihumus leptocrescens TaxID=297536 RepID=A0A542ZGA1_9MICO|nr:ABC transporter ATP-binding protein [Oryzihumus leptocrescens]TQL59361.1 ABC-2 type transport system ATP-binding protein [Oryzihumus leptocrescens]